MVSHRHSISPEDFLVIGNSMKADILPVLALGDSTAHIPCFVIWEAELADEPTEIFNRFFKLENMH
jgi:putative hydrolase of the HAD superfamily